MFLVFLIVPIIFCLFVCFCHLVQTTLTHLGGSLKMNRNTAICCLYIKRVLLHRSPSSPSLLTSWSPCTLSKESVGNAFSTSSPTNLALLTYRVGGDTVVLAVKLSELVCSSSSSFTLKQHIHSSGCQLLHIQIQFIFTKRNMALPSPHLTVP